MVKRLAGQCFTWYLEMQQMKRWNRQVRRRKLLFVQSSFRLKHACMHAANLSLVFHMQRKDQHAKQADSVVAVIGGTNDANQR